MIRVRFCPEFRDEWTDVFFDGPAEAALCNILVSDRLAADADVEIQDEDGEWVPFEEYEHG